MIFDVEWYQTIQMLSRLIIAALCGNIIGLEFKRDRKSAAMYVMIIISLGSALFAMISGNTPSGELLRDNISLSTPLIIAISLLAAGVIVRHQDFLTGMKLAVGLWISGALGLAVGAGFYLLAIIATLISYFILHKIKINSKEDINV